MVQQCQRRPGRAHRRPGSHRPFPTEREAVLDALGDLGIPTIADVECGHVPPYLPIVNGASGSLIWSAQSMSVTQTMD
ncbi:MAG: hypothetical protein ACYCV4_18175 [Dermatophilaceae bacterium]